MEASTQYSQVKLIIWYNLLFLHCSHSLWVVTPSRSIRNLSAFLYYLFPSSLFPSVLTRSIWFYPIIFFEFVHFFPSLLLLLKLVFLKIIIIIKLVFFWLAYYNSLFAPCHFLSYSFWDSCNKSKLVSVVSKTLQKMSFAYLISPFYCYYSSLSHPLTLCSSQTDCFWIPKCTILSLQHMSMAHIFRLFKFPIAEKH